MQLGSVNIPLKSRNRTVYDAYNNYVYCGIEEYRHRMTMIMVYGSAELCSYGLPDSLI
jgi:hypothetical protein